MNEDLPTQNRRKKRVCIYEPKLNNFTAFGCAYEVTKINTLEMFGIAARHIKLMVLKGYKFLLSCDDTKGVFRQKWTLIPTDVCFRL